jgi:tetratricopeptide (TPR) repeat protein
MVRDWDLFSIAFVGLLPLCLLVFDSLLIWARGVDVSKAFAPALAIASVLTLAWIGVNADADRAVSRYEGALQYDKSNPPYVYETLAAHHYQANRMDEAIAALKEAISGNYNHRLYALLGRYYERNGQIDDAIRTLAESLERQPSSDGARRELMLMLRKVGRDGHLLKVAREGTRYHPGEAVYHDCCGRILIKQGRLEEGIHELRTAMGLNPSRRALKEMQQILLELKRPGR